MNTDFSGLILTDKSETAMTFLEWRSIINGTDGNSNMQLIDKAISRLNTAICGKADGFSFSADTGVLQLTSGGKVIDGASVTINLNNYYTKNKTDELLLEKSDISHNHNTIYLTVDEIQGMIDDKPLPVHEHDALYYRKNATNSLLEQKSDINHTHSGMLTTDDISDTVVESGTSGVWSYRKWSSGVAECWCNTSLLFSEDQCADAGFSDSSGERMNLMYTDLTLPFSFVAAPCAVCSVEWKYSEWAQCHAGTKSLRVRLFCNGNSKTYAIENGLRCSIHVKGNWQ